MMRTLTLLLALAATSVTVRDLDGRPQSPLSPAGHDLNAVFFLSADCPISNHYAPEIQRVCGDYRARGVHCFAVYPDSGDVQNVRLHRKDFGFDNSIPAMQDADHALVKAAGPKVTPEVAVFSSTGRIYRGRIDDLYVDVGRTRRNPTRRDLRLALDSALAGKPVAVPETVAVGCFLPTP